MLDTITRRDEPHSFVPSVSQKFTEEQARDDLAKFPQAERPAIRELADRWQWPKSNVGRFLQKIDTEAQRDGQRDKATAEEIDALIKNTVESVKPPCSEPFKAIDMRPGGGWMIDRQEMIDVSLSENTDTIMIEQPDSDGRAHRVDVNRTNAVRLARMILWAAGFNVVTIALKTCRGMVDLEDGSMAEEF